MNTINSSGIALYRCPRCHKEFGSASGYIDHDRRYDPEKAAKARDLVGELVMCGRSIFGRVVEVDECSGTAVLKGLDLSKKEFTTFFMKRCITGVRIEKTSLRGLSVEHKEVVGIGTMRDAFDKAVTSMISDLMCETLSINRSDLKTYSTDMFSGCKVRPEVVSLRCCPKCGQCFEDQAEFRSHADRCNGKNVTDDRRVGAYGTLGNGDRFYGRIRGDKTGLFGHIVVINETSDTILAGTTSDLRKVTRTFAPCVEIADIAVTDFRERALAFFDRVLGGGERP